jgi:hypothetical protein
VSGRSELKARLSHWPPGRRCSTRERDLGPNKPIVELPAPSDE